MVSMTKKQSSKGAPGQKRPKRWSAARKAEVAVRLLRGESLDALARETGQPASRLSEWRDLFLAGGEKAMKGRADDPAIELAEDEKRRLQAKVGESMMTIELLEEQVRRLEDGQGFRSRRSKL